MNLISLHTNSATTSAASDREKVFFLHDYEYAFFETVFQVVAERRHASNYFGTYDLAREKREAAARRTLGAVAAAAQSAAQQARSGSKNTRTGSKNMSRSASSGPGRTGNKFRGSKSSGTLAGASSLGGTSGAGCERGGVVSPGGGAGGNQDESAKENNYEDVPPSERSADVLLLSTMLTFCSLETDKQRKFQVIFDIFDTDDDGCLTHDQILHMYKCIRMVAPVLECNKAM